eukprot:5727723-Amphidinium_carterae.1
MSSSCSGHGFQKRLSSNHDRAGTQGASSAMFVEICAFCTVEVCSFCTDINQICASLGVAPQLLCAEHLA